MRAIDKIKAPSTFYYEDCDGEKFNYDPKLGLPDKEWYAQHIKSVIVRHDICFGNRNKKNKDLFPVRMLKWILCKMPNSWKRADPSMSFNSTVYHSYPLVKYLVENKQFSFNNACVVASELCGRCYELLKGNMLGNPEVYDYSILNTACDYCEQIDPEYILRRRVWCCYRSMKLKGDVKSAYDKISVYGSELTYKIDNKFVYYLKEIKNEIRSFFGRLLPSPKH